MVILKQNNKIQVNQYGMTVSHSISTNGYYNAIFIDIQITFHQRGTRMCMTSSCILIDIRITLQQREMRMCMTSSGILMDI